MMNKQSDYILQRKSRADLSGALKMYGESEPVEAQLDNMWEVVSRSTGAKLEVMEPDFSEFSSSDRMYPSMMKPDVKARWDQKKRELENQKDLYEKIERMARAEFQEPQQARTGASARLSSEFKRDGVETLGVMDAFGGIFKETSDFQTYYIWESNEGACEDCVAKNGEKSSSPTMERPHPNCKCRQIKYMEWTE